MAEAKTCTAAEEYRRRGDYNLEPEDIFDIATQMPQLLILLYKLVDPKDLVDDLAPQLFLSLNACGYAMDAVGVRLQRLRQQPREF